MNSQQAVKPLLVMRFYWFTFLTKYLKLLLSFAGCHFGSTSHLKHQLLKPWTSSRNISIWKNWRFILLLSLCPLTVTSYWHSCMISLFTFDGMYLQFTPYHIQYESFHRMWNMPHILHCLQYFYQNHFALLYFSLLCLHFLIPLLPMSFCLEMVLNALMCVLMYTCHVRLYSFGIMTMLPLLGHHLLSFD